MGHGIEQGGPQAFALSRGLSARKVFHGACALHCGGYEAAYRFQGFPRGNLSRDPERAYNARAHPERRNGRMESRVDCYGAASRCFAQGVNWNLLPVRIGTVCLVFG